MWSDWLVFCNYGFSVSALWCPLATPTLLLEFLLPWMCGISSRLLQQSAATAPYLGQGVSPQGHPSWPWSAGTHCAEVRWLPRTAQKPGWEDPPLTQGQGWRPRAPGFTGAGAEERSYPTSEVRGSSRDELPHARGQGQRPGGATPRPRSCGCTGAGGPREATPRSRLVVGL